jgi:hypothetical protein
MSGRGLCMTVGLLLVAVGCSAPKETKQMQEIAEQYVKLVLAVGQHDPDYVDAYYGPPEWKTAAVKRPLPELDKEAAAIVSKLAGEPLDASNALAVLRSRYLERQTEALRTRVAMLGGRKLTFDQESKALYDAVAPHHDTAEFEAVLAQLEQLLPGSGSLLDRYTRFRDAYVIPPARLAATFKAAIDACRRQTLQHVQLPPGESFTVEYVTGKSWSGYNWYQGNYRSLIQVNTDLPIFADRAIDLACHEGYPGHHVYNVLLEKTLVRDRGWPEFQIYPLFSPQSLIAEGTANYGIEVAFPPADRLKLEREVIFPAAGLEPGGAERYYAVMGLVDRLTYAGNESARRYIDGEVDAAGAAALLEKYGLYSSERAKQRMRFVDQYRSYVINYNLGKDMVAQYIDARAAGDSGKRWAAFAELLSSPRLPSGLAPAGSGR